jgi:hypothetical protein
MSSVNSQGTPWMVTKLRAILKQRYGSIDSSIQRYTDAGLSEMGMAAIKLEGNTVLTFQDWAARDYAGGILSPNTPNSFVKVVTDSGEIVYRFFYHFFHNFSTSVLSMPDSLVYDDLNHLSQRVYYIDLGGWQGDLPVIQTGLVFLNLILLALGLGYSWTRHRWAGMIPMFIFIAYSVSLGAAMNSGGRYLTPIDWVIYFYYGLALVAIIKFAYKGLTGNYQSQPASLDSGGTSLISDRRKLGFSLAGIILLASLIPIANFVLPAVTASARNRADMEAVRESISANENPGVSVVYGEILYPYYDNLVVTFDLLTPTGSEKYTLARPPKLKMDLISGEHAFIALRSVDQENSIVESVYLWQAPNPVPILIWKHQP